MTPPLEVAERALAAARGSDGAQATVTAERSLLLRFARSRPTQATSVDDLTVEITVLSDGHAGRATTNETGDDALRACARAAAAAAETAARSAGPGVYPGFPEPAPVRSHAGYDARTAALDPATGGKALSRAFEVARARGLQAYGIWSAGEVQTAIASSAGIALLDRVTDGFMKVIAIAPDDRSGYAAASAVAADDIDAEALARRAADKADGSVIAGDSGGGGRKGGLADRGADVASLPPGEYPVVFEADAIGELLYRLSGPAFSGLAHAEERGALAGRLCTRVTAPCINLADSPRHPRTLPRSFDAEGVPKEPLPLIEDGVARGIAHDIRSAAIAGTSSTGHALVPGGSADGPVPTNLVLAGGGADGERELCAPIDRGVYVTRLWYANVVRPKETLLTAVTRDGTFLIEDGRIARPLADLRITDRILGILERTEALSARVALISGGEFFGRRFATGVVCPALRASGVRFTG